MGATLAALPLALRAQAGSVPPAADSAAPPSAAHVLGRVTITAERHSPTLREEGLLGRILRVDDEHRQVVGLMAGNHALAARVAQQGKEISRLEARLTYLKTTVTDSLERDIATADAEAADTRAQRLALEVRLEAQEARQVARTSGVAMAGGAGGGR